MAADVKVSPKCTLDSNGCVTLRDILKSFNAPINEEHAWALYYQCAKCIENGIDTDRTKCFLITECEHISMHRDGHVHSNTIFAGGGTADESGSMREPMTSPHELVFNLGIVIFGALDYGLDAEEERHLSADLDRLIRMMTAADDAPKHIEMDDEGIERDSGENDEDPAVYHVHLAKVTQMCINHLGSKATPQSADQHYRAVCKALVFEALELSSFLQKISSRSNLLSRTEKAQTVELDKLQISEWSRLWLQVIQELRHGVNLKKVDFSRTRIEFTLTPYEILMDDIRSHRYKLNKVMVDGDLPHRVKKDAHAVILDFIRSRPPLRKASERKLAPPRCRFFTPREMLMDSIKIGRHLRPSLSPAPTPHPSPMKRRLVPLPNLSALATLKDESPEVSGEDFDKPSRRLIKVDFSSLMIDDDDDDLDDDDDDDRAEVMPKAIATSTPNGGHSRTANSNPWQRTGLSQQEYHSYMDLALESYDLATQCPSGRASIRRHTIVANTGSTDAGSQSVPHSRPESRGPTLSPASSESDSGNLGGVLPEMSWSRSSLQDEFLHSKNWQQAMECLSLTLEEIVHIRSVLTKAELESLPVEGHVKEDVEKRKVCFLCLKTRFGLFGPWGQICKLCKRTVCVKCYSKMRIPTEHFSRVPVFTLSPGLSSPDEDSKESFPRSLMSRLMVPDGARNSVGSAPASPQLQRGDSMSAPSSRMSSSMVESLDGPQSLPALSPASTASDKRGRLNRSKTIGRPDAKSKENLKGLQMNVCHDCKTMVIQIIKSSRTNRTNAIRNLTLNLSPVY